MEKEVVLVQGEAQVEVQALGEAKEAVLVQEVV